MYLHDFFSVQAKMLFLSRRRIPLATLLYGQFIHLTYHFTPQHTAFEQSAACLSVFLELLPGLIPTEKFMLASKSFLKIYLTPVKTQLLQYNLTRDLMLFYHSNKIKA